MEFLTSFSGWCNGPGFWQSGGGSGWHSWMPFHMGSIFQLLVIGLIVYFTVRLFRTPATNSGPTSPEYILRRRYAAGEIDEQTYTLMKEELKNSQQ